VLALIYFLQPAGCITGEVEVAANKAGSSLDASVDA
jgi:hypothetical protein